MLKEKGVKREREQIQQSAPSTPAAQKQSKRRKFQFGKSPNLQGNQKTRIYEHFRRLDPSNPVEAKRMKTRHKEVMKGKNTIGYDMYIKKVPTQTRQKLVEHPSTPDYKADIPNKRWLGLLKAWRISLHQYDPKDFQSSLDSSDAKKQDSNTKSDNANDNDSNAKKPFSPKPTNVKDQQIAEASSSGLQVDFAKSINSSADYELSTSSSDQSNIHQSVSKDSKHEEDDNDQDDINRVLETQDNYDDELLLDYDDSDDELL